MPTSKKVEERIKKEFVTPKHFQAISEMVGGQRLNIIISFRKAGENTIKMLEAGAGAKPHSILDKSIKGDYLSGKDAGVRGIDKLYGLVPTREPGKIKGLYLTDKGIKTFKDKEPSDVYEVMTGTGCLLMKENVGLSDFIAQIGTEFLNEEYFIGAFDTSRSLMEDPLEEKSLAPEDKNTEGIQSLYGLVPRREIGNIDGLYVTGKGVSHFVTSANLGVTFELDQTSKPAKLKTKEGKSLEEFIAAILGGMDEPGAYAPWFITGDYDTHDIISLTGQRHPVVSGSQEEAEIIVKLNHAMAGNGPFCTESSDYIKYWKENLDEYDLIQHGPQYNYISYTYDNEKNQKIVEKVARIDTPVAVCEGNGWSIMETPEDLVRYYEEKSIKVKELWNLTDAGDQYIRDRKGKSFRQFMKEKTGRGTG